jgi:hypothetical protein
MSLDKNRLAVHPSIVGTNIPTSDIEVLLFSDTLRSTLVLLPSLVRNADIAIGYRMLQGLLACENHGLVGCVAGFIWYEAQFTDEVTETIETYTDGGGNAYGTLVSGNRSVVNYGESQSNPD